MGKVFAGLSGADWREHKRVLTFKGCDLTADIGVAELLDMIIATKETDYEEHLQSFMQKKRCRETAAEYNVHEDSTRIESMMTVLVAQHAEEKSKIQKEYDAKREKLRKQTKELDQRFDQKKEHLQSLYPVVHSYKLPSEADLRAKCEAFSKGPDGKFSDVANLTEDQADEAYLEYNSHFRRVHMLEFVGQPDRLEALKGESIEVLKSFRASRKDRQAGKLIRDLDALRYPSIPADLRSKSSASGGFNAADTTVDWTVL
jgi:hypothetical protein